MASPKDLAPRRSRQAQNVPPQGRSRYHSLPCSFLTQDFLVGVQRLGSLRALPETPTATLAGGLPGPVRVRGNDEKMRDASQWECGKFTNRIVRSLNRACLEIC